MKIRTLLTLISLIFLYSSIYGQNSDLPEVRSFKQAVDNNTRSELGVPGGNYWQNSADYEIMVSIIPEERMLKGNETITYYNNSLDTLGRLVFKIYQNLYKKGAPRDFSLNKKDIHEGVEIYFDDSSRFRLIDTIFEENTNLTVFLKDSLMPEDSLQIGLEWKFQIPRYSDVRMGAMDDSAFFLGFWYPRIAVYDDLYGWDKAPHTGNQEFYHDKGDYEVYIAVPRGYFVMGTGLLQNPDVVFNQEYLERYKVAKKSDSIISVIDSEDLSKMNAIFNENVWIYKAHNVPDFAFGISNHHQWDATSILIDTVSNERILIQTAYKEESIDFKEVAKFARETVKYLSYDFPEYPYPFPAVSVFNGTNGTSGMEYPMIANNPSATRRSRTLDVTAHEITHNYFPFYVLTNETQYAWMDESFAAMLPYKLQRRIEPELNRLTRYTKKASELTDTEQHITTMIFSAAISSRVPYYFTNYSKPALALYYLEDLLGTEVFKRALQEYITIWQGKHPTPYDFFNLMNQSTQRDLNWFWEPWFFKPAYPDLAVTDVKENVNEYKITIKRKGTLPVPVRLKIDFEDGNSFEMEESADIWEGGENHVIIPVKTNKKIRKIILGDEYIPDVYLDDNVYMF